MLFRYVFRKDIWKTLFLLISRWFIDKIGFCPRRENITAEAFNFAVEKGFDVKSSKWWQIGPQAADYKTSPSIFRIVANEKKLTKLNHLQLITFIKKSRVVQRKKVFIRKLFSWYDSRHSQPVACLKRTNKSLALNDNQMKIRKRSKAFFLLMNKAIVKSWQRLFAFYSKQL